MAYLATFSGQPYFRRSYFFTLFLTISTQQLLFRSIYFFRAFAFLRCSVFERFISSQQFFFSEYLFFRDKTSAKQAPFENKKFFSAVTFQSSCYFGGVIAQNKDIYRRAPLTLLNSISFFRRATFSKNLIFLESYLFRAPFFEKTLLSIAATFSEELLSQHTFSEKLLFHNYASSPQLQLLLTTLPLHSYTYC